MNEALIPAGCAGDQNHFATTMYLAPGGEASHLDFKVQHQPLEGPIGPGQYPDKYYSPTFDPPVIRLTIGNARWDSGADGHLGLGVDLKSGSVDATLLRNSTDSMDSVHLTGTWRCA